jgi:hypothetical protein
MNPRRQRTIEVTRLSGSSGASRRQSSPVHVADPEADAGERGEVNATGRGPTVDNGARLGTLGVAAWSEAVGGVTSATGIRADGAGSTGLPHGFAIAMPTNPMSRTPTITVTRRSTRPPALTHPKDSSAGVVDEVMVAAYRMGADLRARRNRSGCRSECRLSERLDARGDRRVLLVRLDQLERPIGRDADAGRGRLRDRKSWRGTSAR